MLQGSWRWRASSPPWSAPQHMRCWNPTLSGTVSEQNDGSICLIAEIPNQLVGYALMCKAFEAHTGKTRLWLGDLYVRPAARRSGAGSALRLKRVEVIRARS